MHAPNTPSKSSRAASVESRRTDPVTTAVVDPAAWSRTTRIDAATLDRWVSTSDGQRLLPALVRRLILADGGVTALDMPAGDSVSRPGWDGLVNSMSPSPWTPGGASAWEVSGEARPGVKAGRDFRKRTAKTPAAEQKTTTLVLLTGRRWPRKSDWLKRLKNKGEWAKILVYDADTLEQWLEHRAAVSLWLADLLGLSGPGVESPDRFWRAWAEQSAPAISANALLAERGDIQEHVLRRIRQGLGETKADPITVRADSAAEASTFCAVAVLSQPDLAAASVVVTHSSGWRFVEQNPTIRVAIAAAPEVAERPTRRPGLVVVISYAAGDMIGQYAGAAGAEGPELVLTRLNHPEFEKALIALGVEQGDAKRLANVTGRSWSVFRRRAAVNPALRAPAWLSLPQAGALSTLCLLGSWTSHASGDREVVSRIAGRGFEAVERDLQALALVDDAPVLSIGGVWKAKAPIELLDLFGARITSDELARFFTEAREILTQPDPHIDLPPERAMFTVERPQSDLLREAVCDTMIKLAVRGDQVSGLADRIGFSIEGLVRDLFQDVDARAWLNLASHLPALAEAAPDAFLRAVETSLRRPDTPVVALLTSTESSGMGRCWHAGLLWALETLAWDPRRLARVALALAAMSDVTIAGNWANSPFASLVSLFKVWIPQTSATLDQRIAALDRVNAALPDIGYRLLDALVNDGRFQIAFPAHRPAWRDDDAGAGGVAPNADIRGMLIAASDRQVALAAGCADRIVRLIDKIDIFDAPRVDQILALARGFAAGEATQDERLAVRNAVRHQLHDADYLRERKEDDVPDVVALLLPLYEALEPEDLVVRHGWLFAKRFPKLPEPDNDRDHRGRVERTTVLRSAALREILEAQGLGGVAALGRACAGEEAVGWSLAGLGLSATMLAPWILDEAGDLTRSDPIRPLIGGLLRATPPPQSASLLQATVEGATQRGWATDRLARLLALARDERATWDLVLTQGAELDASYWHQCEPVAWLREEGDDFNHAVNRLVQARRARTALEMIAYDLDSIDADRVAQILEQILGGDEDELGPFESSRVGEALSRLDQDPSLPPERVIRIQFALLPALGFEREHYTRTLYSAVATQPELLVELLVMFYPPRDTPDDVPVRERPEIGEQVASSIYRLLTAMRQQPGQRPDGSIDPDVFAAYVAQARDLATQAGRRRALERHLGALLSRGPADPDGLWPYGAARDLLDEPDAEPLREAFELGVLNGRGVTSRAYNEGGDAERALAREYHAKATAVEASHPFLAAALSKVARHYEREGGREDTGAQLRIEGS